MVVVLVEVDLLRVTLDRDCLVALVVPIKELGDTLGCTIKTGLMRMVDDLVALFDTPGEDGGGKVAVKLLLPEREEAAVVFDFGVAVTNFAIAVEGTRIEHYYTALRVIPVAVVAEFAVGSLNSFDFLFF